MKKEATVFEILAGSTGVFYDRAGETGPDRTGFLAKSVKTDDGYRELFRLPIAGWWKEKEGKKYMSCTIAGGLASFALFQTDGGGDVVAAGNINGGLDEPFGLAIAARKTDGGGLRLSVWEPRDGTNEPPAASVEPF